MSQIELRDGPLLTSFVGGDTGQWAVERIDAITGAALLHVPQVAIIEGAAMQLPPNSVWTLRGVVSHDRYASDAEHDAELEHSPALPDPSGAPDSS